MVSAAKMVSVSNVCIVRDKWLNFCVDLNSFVRKCFARQTKESDKNLVSQANIARASGDIGNLPNKPINELPLPSPVISEKQTINAFKLIDLIHLEGCFRVRKIFSQRTAIPNDVNVDLISTSIDSSASKQAAIPRSMDFLSSANKVNQVLTYDSVIGMSERKLGSVDDSMMITGVKMSGFAKSQA